MPQDTNLTPEIQALLDHVKCRERHLRRVRGAILFLLFLCGLTALGAVFDRFVPASRSTRWLVACSAYGLGLVGFALLWLRPALKKISNVEAAWILERSVKGLDERVISAVELSQSRESGDLLSTQMIRRLAESVSKETSHIPIEKVSPISLLRRPATVLGGVFAVFLLLAVLPSIRFHRLSARFWFPAVRYGRIGSFELRFLNADKDRVARGDPYEFDVVSTTDELESLRLDLLLADGTQRTREVTRDSQGHFRYTFMDTRDSFSYRASAHTVSTDLFSVSVLPRPVIEEFVRVIDWPDYTGRADTREASMNADLEALPGSKGKLIVRTNREAHEVFVLTGEERVQLEPCEDEHQGKSFAYAFEFQDPFEFRVEVVSAEGMQSTDDATWSVRTLADEGPAIELVSRSDNQALFDAGVMPFRYRADDDYGIAYVAVVYSINGSPTREHIFAEDFPPGRTLRLESAYEWNFAELGSGDSNLEFSLFVVDHSGRSGRTDTIFISRRDRLVTARETELSGSLAAAAEMVERISKDLARIESVRGELLDASVDASAELRKEESFLEARVAEAFGRLVGELAAAEWSARETGSEARIQVLRESAELAARVELPECQFARGLRSLEPDTEREYARRLQLLANATSGLQAAIDTIDAGVRTGLLEKELQNRLSRFDAIKRAEKQTLVPETVGRLREQERKTIGELMALLERGAGIENRATGTVGLPGYQAARQELEKRAGMTDGRTASPLPSDSMDFLRTALSRHGILQHAFDDRTARHVDALRRSKLPPAEEFARLSNDMKEWRRMESVLPTLEKRVKGLSSRSGLVVRAFEHPTGLIRAENFDALRKEFTGRKELGFGTVDQVNVKGNPFGGQPFNFLLDFEGWLYIREPGEYVFGQIVDDCAYLMLDDQVVAGARSCKYPLVVRPGDPVDLALGRYAFRLLFSQATGDVLISAHWKRPAEREFSLIPPAAFAPAADDRWSPSPTQTAALEGLGKERRKVALKRAELQAKFAGIAHGFQMAAERLKEPGRELVQPRADLSLLSGVLDAVRRRLSEDEEADRTWPERGLQAVADAEPSFARQRQFETLRREVLRATEALERLATKDQLDPLEERQALGRMPERLARAADRHSSLEPQSLSSAPELQDHELIRTSLRQATDILQVGPKLEGSSSHVRAARRSLSQVLEPVDRARRSLLAQNAPHRDRLAKFLPGFSEQVAGIAREIGEADQFIARARDTGADGDLASAVLESVPSAMRTIGTAHWGLESVATRLRADALNQIESAAPDVDRAQAHASAAHALDTVNERMVGPAIGQLLAAFNESGLASGDATRDRQAIGQHLADALDRDAKARKRLEGIAALLEKIGKALRGELGNAELRSAEEELKKLAGVDSEPLERLKANLEAQQKLADASTDLEAAEKKPDEEAQDKLAEAARKTEEVRQEVLRQTTDELAQKEEVKQRALDKIDEDRQKLASLSTADAPKQEEKAEADLMRPYEPLMEKLGLQEKQGEGKQAPENRLSEVRDAVEQVPTEDLTLPEDPADAAGPPAGDKDPSLPPLLEKAREAAAEAGEQAERAGDLAKREEKLTDDQSKLRTDADQAAKDAVQANTEVGQALSKTLGAELSHDERTRALAEVNEIQRPLPDEGTPPVEAARALAEAAERYRQAARNLEPLVDKSDARNRPGVEGLQQRMETEARRLDEAARELAARAEALSGQGADLARQRALLAAEAMGLRPQIDQLADELEDVAPSVRTQPVRALSERLAEATEGEGEEPYSALQPVLSNLQGRLNELADEAGRARPAAERPATPEDPIEALTRALPDDPRMQEGGEAAAQVSPELAGKPSVAQEELAGERQTPDPAGGTPAQEQLAESAPGALRAEQQAAVATPEGQAPPAGPAAAGMQAAGEDASAAERAREQRERVARATEAAEALADRAAQIQDAERAIHNMQRNAGEVANEDEAVLAAGLANLERQAAEALARMADSPEREAARQALAAADQAGQQMAQPGDTIAQQEGIAEALERFAQAAARAPLPPHTDAATRDRAVEAANALAQQAEVQAADLQARARETDSARADRIREAQALAPDARQVGEALEELADESASDAEAQRLPLLGRQLAQDAARLQDALAAADPQGQSQALDDLRRHAEMAVGQLDSQTLDQDREQEGPALASQTAEAAQGMQAAGEERREQAPAPASEQGESQPGAPGERGPGELAQAGGEPSTRPSEPGGAPNAEEGGQQSGEPGQSRGSEERPQQLAQATPGQVTPGQSGEQAQAEGGEPSAPGEQGQAGSPGETPQDSAEAGAGEAGPQPAGSEGPQGSAQPEAQGTGAESQGPSQQGMESPAEDQESGSEGQAQSGEPGSEGESPSAEGGSQSPQTAGAQGQSQSGQTPSTPGQGQESGSQSQQTAGAQGESQNGQTPPSSGQGQESGSEGQAQAGAPSSQGESPSAEGGSQSPQTAGSQGQSGQESSSPGQGQEGGSQSQQSGSPGSQGQSSSAQQGSQSSQTAGSQGQPQGGQGTSSPGQEQEGGQGQAQSGSPGSQGESPSGQGGSQSSQTAGAQEQSQSGQASPSSGQSPSSGPQGQAQSGSGQAGSQLGQGGSQSSQSAQTSPAQGQGQSGTGSSPSTAGGAQPQGSQGQGPGQTAQSSQQGSQGASSGQSSQGSGQAQGTPGGTGMTPAQQQVAQAASQQALNGLGQALGAMANGQIPEARQGLAQAAQGMQAQEQLFRDLARSSVIQQGGAPSQQGQTGSPNPSQSGGMSTTPGGAGGYGLRQFMGGPHSGRVPEKAIAAENWDKIGEALSMQSRQVRGYDIPPYFRERIKDYFERIAQERRKAQK